MPVSKKRKLEAKENNEKHIRIEQTNWGKILLFVVTISMVVGLLVTAVVYMIQELGK